ncbi:MAG: shikimate kinase [Bacteroidia bacterium]
MEKTVFLIGFMGAGKTTLGKSAANALSWDFVDLDHFIEAEAGKTIREIFEQEGEKKFRETEREALKQIAHSTGRNRIVATGGGAPCFGDNMELINMLGISIYLRPTTATLYDRLRLQKAERPMIRAVEDTDLPAHIEMLLSKREPYYLKAHFVLESPKLNTRGLVSLIEETKV